MRCKVEGKIKKNANICSVCCVHCFEFITGTTNSKKLSNYVAQEVPSTLTIVGPSFRCMANKVIWLQLNNINGCEVKKAVRLPVWGHCAFLAAAKQ